MIRRRLPYAGKEVTDGENKQERRGRLEEGRERFLNGGREAGMTSISWPTGPHV